MKAIRPFLAIVVAFPAMGPVSAAGTNAPDCPPGQAPQPGAAAREFPVTGHGAIADDTGMDTAAIQAAIDACAAAGGGTVRVPKGRFLVGGLRLKDKVGLRFDAGAVFEGSLEAAAP